MFILARIIILSVVVLCCSSLKVGFVLPGLVTDFGYNYQLWLGVQEFQQDFPDVITSISFNVSTNDCLTTATTYMQNGYDLLFFPNAPYSACAQSIATMYPTKHFVVHTGGDCPNLPNLACEFRAGLDEARFILGVLAAKQRQTSKICVMVPKGFGLTARFINYVLLGMRYVGNNDELIIGQTASFDDPASETVVANHFLSIGCDVTMLQSLNSIHALQIIANGGKWGMGTASDMRDFVGESVLTSIILDSNIPFTYYYQKVVDGTFINELFTYTLQNGALQIADYSCDVTKAARKEADRVKNKILAGQLNIRCQKYIKRTFGVPCLDEAQISAQLFPGITVYDGTV